MRIIVAASTLALALAISGCGLIGGQSGGEHGEAEHGEAHAEAGHGESAHGGGHGVQIGPASAHASPAPHNPHAASAAHGAPHWEYRDQSSWASFAPGNSACGAGHEQSPINLSSASPMSELADLSPFYLAKPGSFVNNGHTLQFTPDGADSVLTIGNDAYTLLQFHFHSPAEHTLDRRAFPLELHLVHRNSLGQLAVLGVFIEEGPANDTLGALIAARPTGEGEDHATRLSVDPALLLPEDRAYYAYAGSLTTPPCSEGVRWNVLRATLTASPAQIAALRESLGASSRHVQPINDRTILFGS